MRSGLRFDRVARGFMARLEEALSDAVPKGHALVVTITAPIRQDARTAVAVEEAIRTFLNGSRRHGGFAMTLHGNALSVRLLRVGRRGDGRLVGFVHNPDVNPRLLVEAAAVSLSALAR